MLASCSAPRLDCTKEENKRACIDQINIHLSDNNCASAIDLVEKMYETPFTDNEVRLLRASAQSCKANVNFFEILDSLGSSSGSVAGTGFWSTVAGIFRPAAGVSDFTMDERAEAGWNAAQAAFATVSTGVVLPEVFKINEGTYNPGSLSANHRTDDANLSLFLSVLSIMGNIQNRYGDPNSSHLQTTDFTWTSQSAIDSSAQDEVLGCQYASATIHLLDTLNAISAAVKNDGVQDALDNIITTLRDGVSGIIPGINDACERGCTGHDIATGLIVVDADCNGANASGACNPCPAGDTTCIQCPIELRDRTSCQSNARASCAAAGIIRYTNLGWQDG